MLKFEHYFCEFHSYIGMRIWLLIVVVTIAIDVGAQRNHEPFVGGFEIGLGYGTVIDFKTDNNGFHFGNLPDRLQNLPSHIGLVSAKYINPNKYLEFGLLYSRKSSYHSYRFNDGTYTVSGGTSLVLHCIDLPIKYYSYVGKMTKQHVFAFGGLIPSWIIEPVHYVSDIGIPEDCFRNFCLSVCGGLCYDQNKSRLKLHTGLAVTSVVNANYKQIPEEDRDYGDRIYPLEIMFCYARMFR